MGPNFKSLAVVAILFVWGISVPLLLSVLHFIQQN